MTFYHSLRWTAPAFVHLSTAFKSLLLFLLLIPGTLSAQDDETYDGGNMDPVTISEDEARAILKGLLDVKRFTHSMGISKIAKDPELVAFAEGFVERNGIEVLTIGYIDSEEFWPKVFKSVRINKIAAAETDKLIAAHLMFIPIKDGEGKITSYTVALKLEGKSTGVYDLLRITQEDVEQIAEETTTKQLGGTRYDKPTDAQQAAVQALIAALEQVEQNADPAAQSVELVTFEKMVDPNGTGYGFDPPVRDEIKNDYPLITVGGESTRTAWKSLLSGAIDQVIASDPAAQDLTFEQDGIPINATTGQDNSYTLNLNGSPDGVTGEVLAKVGDVVAGKLNTVSYNITDANIKVVPVNGAGANITTADLQNTLNAIYKPAIASWNVEVLDNQTLTGWDSSDGLDDGETGMLSNYTDEMNALIKSFKDQNGRDRNAYYIFLVDRAENASKKGYMPRKKQWGFVFTASHNGDKEAIMTTIAHELGHGVYRLEHTFSEKGIPQNQTQNLMDYSSAGAGAGGRELYKYQWDYVHNPASVMTLFDEEEEGALVAATMFDALFEESEIDVIPTEDAQTELTSGGIILTYKGQQVTFNGFRVSFSLNPGNGELTITQIAPRYSPDDISTINILIARATNRFKELLDARDDYPPFENVSVAQLAMEEEATKIKEFLAQTIETLNQEGDQLEDFIGLPEEEKEKLKTAIADFKDNRSIDSKVTVLDETTFDGLKDSFTPEKEVHLLLGKTSDGYKKEFYYQDDFFNYPTAKTTASGESISLDYQQSDVETIRDQHIDNSIDNPNAIGDLTKKPEPTLNIFERGMWVVKVTKETLAEIKVPVAMWNSEVETDTYPFELESLTAGLGDGAVDELKSIPDLLVLALSLFDEQERTALLQALEQLDYETVKKMFQEKADKYAGGGDVAFHEAGYDGVQIASMFWGGAFIQGAKKGSETAEAITDVLAKFPTTITDKLSNLSYAARRTLLEDLGKSDELLEAFSKNADLLDSWKLLDEAGVDETLRRNLEALADPDAALDAIQMSQKSKPTWPEIMALFKRGNDFNAKGRIKYGDNRVEVVLKGVDGKAGKRLDTYIPPSNGSPGQIISRKATTLSEINPNTFKNYLNELITKYPNGAELNSSKFPPGTKLDGDYKLEIPKSNQSFFETSTEFQNVLNTFKTSNGVKIEIIYLVE
ncbi:MAG: hypothetical protein RIC35_17220 [Marinoscillum sp.]